MEIGGTIESILAQKGREIFSVSPDASVFDAIQMMDNRNIGAVLVVESGQVAGIFSERDYTRKLVLRGKQSRETPVREIMSTDVTTVTLRDSVDSCLRKMTDKRIRHLPVCDGGELKGIISIGDLVKYVISSQSATIDHLEHYISGGFSR